MKKLICMKAKRMALEKTFFALTMMAGSLSLCAQESETVAALPTFSKKHGIYEKAFALKITPSVEGREIRYTTDCSEPTRESRLYGSGVVVNKTTVVRAVEVISEDSLSDVVTATYLFSKDIIHQACSADGKPIIPDGYPSTWGKFDTEYGVAPAYYAMDSYIVGESESQVLKGFSTLPIVSVVTDKGNLFNKEIDDEKGGIYIYTGSPMGDGTGRDWERKVSMEMIGGELNHDLTVDCGLKLHGGHSRLPEKNPKHAFKLRFKSKYGPSKLHYPVFGDEGVDKFEDLVLRTYFGNAWIHWDEGNRQKAQYTRDLWARSIQERLGHPNSKGQAVHLFLNGMYWGMYNLCERITADHFAAHYGGKAKDYDVIKVEETEGEKIVAADGTLDAWRDMCMMVEQVKSSNNYMLYRLEGKDDYGDEDATREPMLDLDAFIDYMLINIYAGNTDWDHHNWFAFRKVNEPEHGFRFLCWDTELIFGNVNENVTGLDNSAKPSHFLKCLMRNGRFKQLFNHRAHELLTGDGLLTEKGAVEVWDSLYHNIEYAIYDESARWGCYRRDIHPYMAKGHRYRIGNYFMVERERLLTDYFPKRTAVVIQQLKNLGWYVNADEIEDIMDAPSIASKTVYDLQGRACGRTDELGNMPNGLKSGVYVVGGIKIRL